MCTIISFISLIPFVLLCRLISAHISFFICAWSPNRKYFHLWRSSDRWPVTTQEAVQLSGDDRVRSRSARPTYLAQIWVTSQSGISSSNHWNNSGKKFSHWESSTRHNACPTSGEMWCMKAHSCWRDFWVLEYSVCGFLHATPSIIFTATKHPSAFYPSHFIFSTDTPSITLR